MPKARLYFLVGIHLGLVVLGHPSLLSAAYSGILQYEGGIGHPEASFWSPSWEALEGLERQFRVKV